MSEMKHIAANNFSRDKYETIYFLAKSGFTPQDIADITLDSLSSDGETATINVNDKSIALSLDVVHSLTAYIKKNQKHINEADGILFFSRRANEPKSRPIDFIAPLRSHLKRYHPEENLTTIGWATDKPKKASSIVIQTMADVKEFFDAVKREKTQD